MLIRIFVLICLLLPGLFLLAFDKAHYTVTDFFQASVDWSDMKVSASVEEKLPRVVINTRDRDFGKEEVAFNISEARTKSLNKARENVKIKLYRLIENLQLDDKYSILDKLHADEKFRINFNQIHTQDVGFYSVSYKNNYATVDSYIPILGKRGIMNFVALEMGTEDFPVFQEAKYPVKYTGLIVDARHLKGAKPSLFPRIKTDDGLDIYSQYLVNRDYAIEQGLALFQIDPMHAMEDKRVGNKPYFVVANSVSGEVKTNFSIATVDAVKLLSHPETRKNLKMCKVIILLPGRL